MPIVYGPTDWDPISGMPRRKTPTPLYGPGPAEPKSPALGGYGGAGYGGFPATAGTTPGVYDPVTAPGGASSGQPGASGQSRVPSLQELIANDELFLQLQRDLAAQGISDSAQRRAARQRAVTMFGEVPDFTTLTGAGGLIGPDLGLDIDEVTRGLAAQNTTAGLSTVARLDQAHTDRLRQIKNVLAARGALRSGETGYQLGREQEDYTRAQYDARQQVVDYLAGVQAAFAQSERQRQMTLAQALWAAAQRLRDEGYPGGGDTSPPVGQGFPPVPLGPYEAAVASGVWTLPPEVTQAPRVAQGAPVGGGMYAGYR